MAKTKTKRELDLFLRTDGFYAGYQLKNEELAKGARLITEEEILTMFTTLMRAYHSKTGESCLQIEGNDGMTVVATLVPTEPGELTPPSVE